MVAASAIGAPIIAQIPIETPAQIVPETLIPDLSHTPVMALAPVAADLSSTPVVALAPVAADLLPTPVVALAPVATDLLPTPVVALAPVAADLLPTPVVAIPTVAATFTAPVVNPILEAQATSDTLLAPVAPVFQPLLATPV